MSSKSVLWKFVFAALLAVLTVPAAWAATLAAVTPTVAEIPAATRLSFLRNNNREKKHQIL